MITEIIVEAFTKDVKAAKPVPFKKLTKRERKELNIVKQEKQILAYCQ